MPKNIKRLFNKVITTPKNKWVPIPKSQYVTNPNQVLPEHDTTPLSKEKILEYMHIVGSCLWIQGVRPDITFAIIYLTWFTSNPQMHHLVSAYHLVQYLNTTEHLPLVLGGIAAIILQGIHDSALGVGPKG